MKKPLARDVSDVPGGTTLLKFSTIYFLRTRHFDLLIRYAVLDSVHLWRDRILLWYKTYLLTYLVGIGRFEPPTT